MEVSTQVGGPAAEVCAARVKPDSSAKIAALRKKLVRRRKVDRSQTWRRSFQAAFVLLNVWIGGLFYAWVKNLESGAGRAIARPAGVEGWLPIAGLMNLRYWMGAGKIPATHPAAFFLFVAFVAMAFLLRKAFCSWLCPIGTLSELLWQAGQTLFRRNFRLVKWIDLPLRGLKYLLLGFFVYAVANMSADSVQEFMHSPWGAIADVRMLNFFPHDGRDSGGCAGGAGGGVGTGEKFLVPLFVSVWGAAGAGGDGESAANPADGGSVY